MHCSSQQPGSQSSILIDLVILAPLMGRLGSLATYINQSSKVTRPCYPWDDFVHVLHPSPFYVYIQQ